MKLTLLGVIAALTVAGTACGGDDDAADGAGDTGTTVASDASVSPTSASHQCGGDTLRVGTFTEARSLDPTMAPGNGTSGGTELAAIYDTLMAFNPRTGEHEPRLAKSLIPNRSFTKWTLTLREGVTFSNGDPLTSGAVRFTLDRHRAPDSQSTLKNVASLIETMDTPDEQTVVFNLAAPWSGFASLLAGSGGMVLNPAAVTAVGDEAFAQDPVGGGAGPFVVERYAPGEELVLAARSDYWRGAPCLESVVFTNLPSAEGTYDSFAHGETDVAVLRNSQTIEEARSDGVSMFTTLLNAGRYWQMNNGARGSTPPTADVRVRKAFAYAMDPDVINERMVAGTGLVSTALIHPDSALYDGAEGPHLDREQAIALVEEAKADGWDGAITLTCTATPEGSDLAIATEGLLKAVGFDVDVELLDRTAAIQKVIVNADYDAFCSSLGIYDTDPWSVLVRQLTDGDSPSSYVGYTDPDMDAALADLQAAPDVEARAEALVRIQEVWNDTMPGYTSFALEEAVLLADGLNGVQQTQESIILLDRASIDPD